VRDMAKAGHIVQAGRGRYDVAAIVPRYCEHLRKLALGRGGEPAIAAATKERARLAKAQADMVKIKCRVLQGALLDAEAVERQWSSILSMVRAGMPAVPSRASQRSTSHAIRRLGDRRRDQGRADGAGSGQASMMVCGSLSCCGINRIAMGSTVP